MIENIINRIKLNIEKKIHREDLKEINEEFCELNQFNYSDIESMADSY